MIDWQVEILFKKFWRRMKKQANVIGFDGVLRPKEINDKVQKGWLTWRIYVEKKLPEQYLKKRDVIPETFQLKGYRNIVPQVKIDTDIIAIGKPVIPPLLGMGRSTQDKWRPLEAGISSMHYQGTACSLNAFFLHETIKEVLQASNMHCVKDGTKLLSNPSFNNFSESNIVIGSKGFPVQVSEHFQRHYEGKMIDINFRGKEISFTPEHLIWAIKCPYNIKCGHSKQEYYNFAKKEWIEAQKLKRFDLLIVPKMSQGQESYDLEKAYWLGFYIAEGTFQDNYNQPHDSWTLEIGNQDKEKLERLLPIFGGKIISENRTEGKIFKLRICRGKFVKWIAKIIGKEKRIPKFIFESNRKMRESFLNGLMDGDGHSRKKDYSISTSSRELADDYYVLILSLGIVPYVWETEQKQSYKNYKWVSHMYNLGWSRGRHRYYEDKQYFYVPIYKIHNSYYTGIVRNLETEDNVYCLPFIVHNCFGLEGDAKIGDAVMNPSPYDGGKLPDDKTGEYVFGVPITFDSFTCPFRNFITRKLAFWQWLRPVAGSNDVDISFATVDVDWKNKIAREKTGFKGYADPIEGNPVAKCGRTTDRTQGVWESTSMFINCQYRRGIALMNDVAMANIECAGGDSGSPMYNPETLTYNAALFAGSEQGKSFGCKIGNIMNRAQVKLIIKEE